MKKYDIFKSEIKYAIDRVFGTGGFTIKRETLCKKCFNKRMNISDTVSHIILNS